MTSRKVDPKGGPMDNGKRPRLPPWHYPRDLLPSRWTLQEWRKKALQLAKAAGYRSCCQLCKRPVDQWGRMLVKHPRSYGNSRQRRICITCANLVIHMLDVLEWFGACDTLPAEYVDGRGVTPEEMEERVRKWYGEGREVLSDATDRTPAAAKERRGRPPAPWWGTRNEEE